jgi:hypothetical protein
MVLALTQQVAAAPVTFKETLVSSGPSEESPNFETFGDNMIDMIEAGNSTAGTSGSVGYVNSITEATAPDTMETPGFNSWRGNADPSGSFADEHGNELFWGIHIQTADSTHIRATDLQFEFSTQNTTKDWWNFSGSITDGYTDFFNGLIRDDDGNITNRFEAGHNDTFVDDIVGVVNSTSLQPGSGTGQSAVNDVWTDINDEAPFEITGEYTAKLPTGTRLNTGSKTISVKSTPVPTPSSIAMGAAGFLFVVLESRRLRHRY